MNDPRFRAKNHTPKLYHIKQEAWDAVPELREATRRPQPIVNEIQWGAFAGMVMLAFPYRWWHPEDLEGK